MTLTPRKITVINNLITKTANLPIGPAPIIRTLLDTYPEEFRKIIGKKINVLINVWSKLAEDATAALIPVNPETTPAAIHFMAEKNAADLVNTHSQLNVKSLYADFCVIQAIAANAFGSCVAR